MVDKFRGLEGKIRKELEKLKGAGSDEKIAAFEQVLQWIKELNDMEIAELRQIVV